jgi:DNA-binding NtrC family response regulator
LPTSQADRLAFPGLNHPYRADANSRRAESVSSATATVEPACHPSLEARVDVLERRIIEDCLARNNFRRKETAAELGISRVTLYNKMKKFGLM